jgi:hypothetical protein
LDLKFSRVVIFYLNTKPDNDEDRQVETDFPNQAKFWKLWKPKDSSYARTFDTEKQAEEFLKCHIQPNFAYKICSWEQTEKHRMYSNVPELVEVEEI